MSHIRTNYRIRSQDIIGITSFLIVDSYYDSFSDFVTVSMGGYGKPGVLFVVGHSALSGAIDGTVDHCILPTQSFSGSCGWIYIYESTQHMTGTARIYFAALIASR